jgi:hypothetical protein
MLGDRARRVVGWSNGKPAIMPKNVGPANDRLSQRRLSVSKPTVPPGALAVGARRMQARKRRDFVKDAKLSQI